MNETRQFLFLVQEKQKEVEGLALPTAPLTFVVGSPDSPLSAPAENCLGNPAILKFSNVSPMSSPYGLPGFPVMNDDGKRSATREGISKLELWKFEACMIVDFKVLSRDVPKFSHQELAALNRVTEFHITH